VNWQSLKRAATDRGKVIILLLDEVAVVVLVVVVLRFVGLEMPLPVTITLAVVGGILVFVVHAAVIPTFRQRQITGKEGMAGGRGTAVTALRPEGTVAVRGEYWKALSVDGDIESDQPVEIVAVDGLTLRVRREERPRQHDETRRL
jgi:membrane-bound ClpP family serine protease